MSSSFYTNDVQTVNLYLKNSLSYLQPQTRSKIEYCFQTDLAQTEIKNRQELTSYTYENLNAVIKDWGANSKHPLKQFFYLIWKTENTAAFVFNDLLHNSHDLTEKPQENWSEEQKTSFSQRKLHFQELLKPNDQLFDLNLFSFALLLQRTKVAEAFFKSMSQDTRLRTLLKNSDHAKFTSLHFAAIQFSKTDCSLLDKLGADLNAQNFLGATPKRMRELSYDDHENDPEVTVIEVKSKDISMMVMYPLKKENCSPQEELTNFFYPSHLKLQNQSSFPIYTDALKATAKALIHVWMQYCLNVKKAKKIPEIQLVQRLVKQAEHREKELYYSDERDPSLSKIKMRSRIYLKLLTDQTMGIWAAEFISRGTSILPLAGELTDRCAVYENLKLSVQSLVIDSTYLRNIAYPKVGFPNAIVVLGKNGLPQIIALTPIHSGELICMAASSQEDQSNELRPDALLQFAEKTRLDSMISAIIEFPFTFQPSKPLSLEAIERNLLAIANKMQWEYILFNKPVYFLKLILLNVVQCSHATTFVEKIDKVIQEADMHIKNKFIHHLNRRIEKYKQRLENTSNPTEITTKIDKLQAKVNAYQEDVPHKRVEKHSQILKKHLQAYKSKFETMFPPAILMQCENLAMKEPEFAEFLAQNLVSMRDFKKTEKALREQFNVLQKQKRKDSRTDSKQGLPQFKIDAKK